MHGCEVELETVKDNCILLPINKTSYLNFYLHINVKATTNYKHSMARGSQEPNFMSHFSWNVSVFSNSGSTVTL